MPNIAIFSQEHDIHALAIAHALRQRQDVSAHLIATDALAESGGIRWHENNQAPSELRTVEGKWIDLRAQDVIWWRRVNQPQKLVESLPEGELKDFVNNEWRTAIFGIAHSSFKGIWVNKPTNDAIAGNKLIQLQAAKEQGFAVPRTLVSQDFDAVKTFLSSIGGHGIAKKLMGTRHAPLATVHINERELDRRGVTLCPAIYQEKVKAKKHLRVNCFGHQIHTISIDSPIMDWRRDMSVSFSPYALAPEIRSKLLSMLRRLGLEMGVFDMILTDKGETIWLELNTQGQFLFGEGLAKHDLTNPFCDFLIDLGLNKEVCCRSGDCHPLHS
ncbi:MAG: hypothetical protein KDJ18_05105 [Hyphomicrobiaceae bacterium]|nr:hypothetical protein [Hyphomicrobiaceae bacterium]